jgi:hypothetical protein
MTSIMTLAIEGIHARSNIAIDNHVAWLSADMTRALPAGCPHWHRRMRSREQIDSPRAKGKLLGRSISSFSTGQNRFKRKG